MSALRTSLYQWHVEHGGRIVPFGGWEMPVQYATGIVAEHKAVRTAVGLFDISHMARVSVGGLGSLAFLEYLATNSVATMAQDQVRYALLCDETGGIIDDILIYRWPYGFSLVVNASNRVEVLRWMELHRAGRDVEIVDQTDRTAMVAVQGPGAVAAVSKLFDTDVSTLKYYYATPALYCRNPCVVSRTGYTGEDGFEVIVPNEYALSLWDELVGRGVVPCGLGARDTLRLEAAMPLYGHELSRQINPIDAGLGWAVKRDKGEFIGRDKLPASPGTGPVRVGLRLEGKRAAREHYPVMTTTGEPIGTVTSGSFAPTLEQSIAMAYVQPTHSAIGTSLLVDSRGTMIPAVVTPLPFYKRKKATP